MNSSDRQSIDLNLNQVNRSIRESGLLAIGAFATCVALAAFASTQLTPKYTADSKLLFTKVDRTSVLTGFGAAGDDSGQLQSLLNDQTPLSTQIEVLQSRPLLQETIDILELQDNEGKPLTPEVLNNDLSLSIIGGTDIIEITYTHPDPQTAASVVNTLIEQYRENSIDASRAEAREAKEFLLAQLPQTETVVRQAEADLRNFLERNQVGVLDEEARSLVGRIGLLSNQIATVQADLESAGSQFSTLQGKLGLNPQQALLVGVLSQNPGVQEAIIALQTVERDLAAQQARFSPNSPVVRQLRAQQESLQSFLQEQIQIAGGSNVPSALIQGTPNQQNITQALIQSFLDTEVEYTGLQQQLAVLKSYQTEYQSRLESVPFLSAEQRALERRVAVAEETYSALLTRLQELQVQENETAYNTRIIQPATAPLEPDSGRELKVIALGVMAGVLLAIATIVVSELFQVRSRVGSSPLSKTQDPMPQLNAIDSGAGDP
jgi:uncharacterized protein involved in exopolysaccharide biosynthesis